MATRSFDQTSKAYHASECFPAPLLLVIEAYRLCSPYHKGHVVERGRETPEWPRDSPKLGLGKALNSKLLAKARWLKDWRIPNSTDLIFKHSSSQFCSNSLHELAPGAERRKRGSHHYKKGHVASTILHRLPKAQWSGPWSAPPRAGTYLQGRVHSGSLARQYL